MDFITMISTGTAIRTLQTAKDGAVIAEVRLHRKIHWNT